MSVTAQIINELFLEKLRESHEKVEALAETFLKDRLVSLDSAKGFAIEDVAFSKTPDGVSFEFALRHGTKRSTFKTSWQEAEIQEFKTPVTWMMTNMLERAIKDFPKDPPPPTDMSARTTIHGTPMGKHLEIDPATGMQKDYVVLTEEERKKGFVRPVRSTYKHAKCGQTTTMSNALAETYAREPKFYSGTYCATCKRHFPVGEDGEFTWYGTKEKVGT